MKKIIFYTYASLLILFFVSCTNELSDFLDSSLHTEINKDNQNLNSGENAATTNLDDTKQNREDNSSNKKQDEIIILTSKDTDIDSIIKAIDATLIRTVIIENKVYTKVRGDINLARTHQKVLSVEKEVYREAYATPNDTFYSSQYSPVITGLKDVWDNYTGNGVKVAVIDTGVNTLHEDFGGSGTFEAGYDYADDVEYSTTRHNDTDGHGTHVAGIIGARQNNDKGISGVAPDVTIIPYRASGSNGGFASADLAAAIINATDKGANVINMSLGGFSTSGVEGAAIRYALSKNVNVVVASGNEHLNLRSYPASYPGVIAVGSSNGRDEVSDFSTRNSLLSIVAPGEDIFSLYAGSTSNTGGYVAESGTSMAAPFVSGVVALIMQKFPTATPAQVKALLEETAVDIGDTGFDIDSGYGRVDPKAALAVASLPTNTWQELTFEVKQDSSSLEDYAITIMDSSNTNIYTVITDNNGLAYAYLPSGNYSYISNLYNAVFDGTLTLGNTAQTESISISTSSSNFDNMYRLSTFYYVNSVDTIMYLFDSKGNLVASNDDKSDSDRYSEILFAPKSGETYTVRVIGYNTETGYYRIMLQRKLSTEPPASDGASCLYSDTTDDTYTGTSKANLVDQGTSYSDAICGRIYSSSDADTFTITIP